MIEGDELKAYLKSLAEYNEIKDITSTAATRCWCSYLS